MVHLIISVPLPQIPEQIVDVPVPQVMEETVEAAKSIPQERVQRRTLEEIVGVLVLLEVLAASRAVPSRGENGRSPRRAQRAARPALGHRGCRSDRCAQSFSRHDVPLSLLSRDAQNMVAKQPVGA